MSAVITLTTYFGLTDTLEVSLEEGSAADFLNAEIDDEVRIK